ncbi:MAG TPA: SURF1 family protein [Nocardioidaceae bacterium]
MRFLLSRRWLLFLGAVLVLAYLAFRLGEWQFDRLDEREQRNTVTARNISAEPVPVEEVLAVGRPVGAEDEWRRVSARGVYADEHSVVVRYQTRDGQSGVDVVTPLVTEEGPALLVNRGWLGTGNVGTTRPDLPEPPSGEVDVTAWVRADATGGSAEVSDGSTRAVSSVEIAETVPFPVYGGFVELDEETPPPAEPLAKVETPDLGEGPHFFYGLQWWFFALLAIIGFGYLVWDERRRQRVRAEAATREDVPVTGRTGAG